MITVEKANFSLVLGPAERTALIRLAEESGRTPASVLRRLISLADLPEARRLLGLPADEPEPQAAEVMT